jgi:hypothetical protein
MRLHLSKSQEGRKKGFRGEIHGPWRRRPRGMRGRPSQSMQEINK